MTPRSQPPVPGAPPAVHMPRPQRRRLRNGLEVLLVERRELPVVDAQLVVRAGGYDDDAHRAGRARLTAELLDQGTTTRTATQIAEDAELLGASLHTRGSWDFCTTALHVLTPRLRPALELLADVATRPTFPDAEFARKRAERLTAIMQDADEPRIIANIAFAHGVYGDTQPYGLPIGGTTATVERLTAAHLRDFYATHFAPAHAFLVLVGDAPAGMTMPLLDDLFGDWAMAPAAAARTGERRTPPHEPAPERPARTVAIVDLPGAPQSELRVGCAGPPRATPDYFAIMVANTILGGAFTSRLNMKLREEKGYTYGAGSSFALRRGGGPFLASTAVATAATADAVSDIIREVGRMSRERVAADELERARNYIVLGLPRSFETTGDIADHLSDVALYGLGDDYYDHYAERIMSVTVADVQAAAQRWLREESLAVVIAGDAAAVSTAVEALDIGVVHVRTAS